MRQLCSLLLAAVLLTGCAPAAGEPLTEPPALTVSAGGASVEALRGTYTWNYDNGDGSWTGVTADSLHPLDEQALAWTPVLETDAAEAVLAFGADPAAVDVRCWSDDCRGDTDAESRAVSVDGRTIPLEAGCIYEVHAEWTEARYGGDAYYAFATAG